MRTLLTAVSVLALSGSLALAQTPPPPPPAENGAATEQPATDENGEAGEDLPQSELDAGGLDHHAPDGVDERTPGEAGQRSRGEEALGNGPRHEMHRGAPRHHMGRDGPRGGPGWRAMRAGPEFTVETDEDGGVKVEVKCGPREEARACADITLELLDRALGN